jgi:hypothetical protein
MRGASFRATETYYAHSLTILRLDGQVAGGIDDGETLLLRRLTRSLDPEATQNAETTVADRIAILSARLQAALADPVRRGEAAGIMEEISQIASGAAEAPLAGHTAGAEEPRLVQLPREVAQSVHESLALKTRVHAYPYDTLLNQRNASATAALLPQISQRHELLGLRPVRLVDDLPVISATIGYTRRSFEPVYEEQHVLLPTQLNAFYALTQHAAQRLGGTRFQGATPILAREGEHEGIFIGLDDARVARWLRRNGVALNEAPDAPPLMSILQALEPSDDRYYDRIWDQEQPKRVLRLVFGLVHSLSHAAMRAAAHFAGMERTSLSEYLFLPLLGSVIYANNGSFKLGSMETLIRNHLLEFLDALSDDAMTCLLDPDCIDHRGSCAGCLHSPEISCRAFNHGLSRAFLQGGHTPWVAPSRDERLIGYWDLEETQP